MIEASSPSRGASTASVPDTGAGPRMSGRISLLELLSTVLAYSAPVAVVSGFIPFVIIFDGIGAPMVFLVAMLMMLLFAVGFTTMTRYVPNPGAFYAYISAGAGKVPGLGAAFLAIFGYLLLAFCTFPFIGVNFNALVTNTFGGPELPWYVYGFLSWAICGLLSYLRIDLSAKVLTIAMALEVIIVAIFNVSVVTHGGPEGFSATPFTWGAFTSGSVGVSVLFAVTCFIGFEATAVFRDEVKNPERNVPLAAYLAVLFIGVFYCVTAYLVITAVGAGAASALANKDPAGLFSAAVLQYVGKTGVDIVRVLLVTSIFASALSGQNIVSRYLFTLGSDGVLPKALAKIHPQHKSPFVAAMLVSAFWFVLMLVFIYLKTDASLLYGRVAGVGGFAVLLLMLFTSASVVMFFKRQGPVAASKWHTLIAPVLATVGLAVIVYLAISNFDLLIGGTKADALVLQIVTWGIFAAGMLLAMYYKRTRHATYQRIGGGEL
ncbi:APC family permease [Pseudomonas sp. dw_358]|uniref:APC family permease n=1 Tax=Pseudomonas sp. dw_358 TaxID=2720083 RepID=UPI001BD3C7C9|nr:APC family permease [Pseudomonas sp. dw_358]